MSHFSLQTLLLDLQWLIALGPKPFQSEANQRASIGIQERMTQSGWEMSTINLKGNLIGCKGKGHTIFLAHHDTVFNSPGAVDNSSGVATLLELARNTKATDICIGFPNAEELGLVGSKQMVSYIQKWHPNPEEIRLVVSLELVGQGTLWVSGLSKQWNAQSIVQLRRTPNLQYEYAYQIVSRLFPTMERSDHKPFADEGYTSMMIVGRDKNGIFPRYHSPEDTLYEEETFPLLLETLESLATKPLPQSSASPSPLIFGATPLPAWCVWVINLLGIGLGFREIRRITQTLRAAAVSIIPIGVIGCIGLLLTSGGIFLSTPQEQTAMNVFGLPASGWWNAASWFTFSAIICFFVCKRIVQTKGSASLMCAIFSIPMIWIDPFLAFPMSLAGIGAYFWSPLAILGALYWIQPSILRELSFHGLIPPYFWFGLCVLLIPILGHSHVRNRSSD